MKSVCVSERKKKARNVVSGLNKSLRESQNTSQTNNLNLIHFHTFILVFKAKVHIPKVKLT